MTDQPASFDSKFPPAETTPVENVSALGRWEIPRRPMTPRAALAAFLHAAVLADLDRRR